MKPAPLDRAALATAAREAAARGWSVIQTRPDKKPIGKWKQAQLAAASVEDVERAWFNAPEAWLGIVTGEVSGLLVVDLDAKGVEEFKEAKATVEALIPEGLVTPIARTRSGGEHYYFRRPASGMGNRAHVRDLPLDIRCDGGYVVSPPSPGYTWIVSPSDAEPAEIPAGLLDLLRAPSTPILPDIDATPEPRPVDHDHIIRRAERYVDACAPAVSGQDGHGTTLTVACALVHGFELPEVAAWPILCAYNRRCEPPWSEVELRHKLSEAAKLTTHQKPRGHLLDASRAAVHAVPLRAPAGMTSGGGEAPAGAPPSEHDAQRKQIKISADESRVVGEAAEALTHHLWIYQRGGMLVRVVDDSPPATRERSWLSRDLCAPRIEPLPRAWVEVRLTEVAQFLAYSKKEDEWKGTIPPRWVVDALSTSPEIRGIRHLVGIAETPQMRPDGSLLERPGYDRSTGLVYRPLDRIPPIKAEPTIDDAVKARDELLEVASDFPFESDAHRGAWLSMILTGMARCALDGSVPLFLVDANVRGAGKTLLAQATSIIMTGRQSPVMLWPQKEDEQAKSITALALAGDNVVLLDNVDGVLGGAALNAALTSTTWEQRILGVSKMTARLPLTAIWIATGNNCELGRDTTRRTIHIRIQSPLEHPEDRTGWKHPNLKQWVQANRPRLVADALTILRAYEVAGRPDMKLGPMADYIAWSRIRNVIAWIGYPDPLATQRALSSQADRDAGELRSLLLGIQSVTGPAEWVTASDMLVRTGLPDGVQFNQALLEYCADRNGGLPSPKSLGWRLRRYVGRVADGMALECKDSHSGLKLWRVAGERKTAPGTQGRLV
jgi:hypothetical protein